MDTICRTIPVLRCDHLPDGESCFEIVIPVPEHLKSDPVRVGQVSVQIGFKDCLGEQVGKFTKPFLALVERLFRPFSFGNLADRFDRTDNHSPGVIQRRGSEPECGALSVVEMGDGNLGEEFIPLPRDIRVSCDDIWIIVQNKVNEDRTTLVVKWQCVFELSLPEYLFCPDACHLLHRLVPCDDDSAGVDGKCGIGQEIDYVRFPALVVPDTCLCSSLEYRFLDFMGKLGKLGDRFSALLDVEVCPLVERLDNNLFAPAPGKYDERDVVFGRTDQLEKFDAVHLRHLVVRNDCFERRFPEQFYRFFPGGNRGN